MRLLKLAITFFAVTASLVAADPDGIRSADDRSLEGVGADWTGVTVYNSPYVRSVIFCPSFDAR